MKNKNNWFIDAYIIAVPTSLMINFTWDSIMHHGIFCVNMTNYGEYYPEVIMELLWFVFVIYKVYKHAHG